MSQPTNSSGCPVRWWPLMARRIMKACLVAIHCPTRKASQDRIGRCSRRADTRSLRRLQPSDYAGARRTHPPKRPARCACDRKSARYWILEIVRRFLADGYRVALAATKEEHIARALDLLGCPEDRLYAERIDATRHNDVQGFVSHIRERWREIAILVNNAGISPKRVDQNAPWLSQTSLDEWARVIDVNLNGPFNLIRFLAPAMIAKGYGRIINVGSHAGRAMPMIAGPHYAASKAGLVGLSRAVARDLAPHGITFNCIAPGRIVCDLTGPPEAAVNRSALSRILVGRFGTAEEVAHVVSFLASRMPGFITGTTIDITRGEFAT